MIIPFFNTSSELIRVTRQLAYPAARFNVVYPSDIGCLQRLLSTSNNVYLAGSVMSSC